MKLKSVSNTSVRRRSREARVDKIEGNRLATLPKLTKKMRGSKMRRNLIKSLTDTVAEGAIESPVRVRIVSESHDVIFVPATQTTRYSAQREATRNLTRRMPGYQISVQYGSGDGMLRFFATATVSVDINDKTVMASLSADCIASPDDMAIRHVEVTCNGNTVRVEPSDRAMYPEEAAQALSRIAANVVKGM